MKTDLEYFKDKIKEELDGSINYIKRALEIKPMSIQWTKKFMDMSLQELEHANTLYKMFEEYYEKLNLSYTNVPDYIQNIRECIIDEYTEESARIKYMHSTVNN